MAVLLLLTGAGFLAFGPGGAFGGYLAGMLAIPFLPAGRCATAPERESPAPGAADEPQP